MLQLLRGGAMAPDDDAPVRLLAETSGMPPMTAELGTALARAVRYVLDKRAEMAKAQEAA
jgi:hypothetical protein